MKPPPNESSTQERELYRKVRRLALRTMRPVRTDLAGAYGSVFHGPGLAFRDLRHYEAGDDVRRIDWHALARFGVPFVKEFVQERELCVLLLVDLSASMDFKSVDSSKREVAAEAVAALALSAAAQGDRVGAMLFAGPGREVETVAPGRATRRAMRVMRGAMARRPRCAAATDARPVLRLLRGLRRGAVVFVVSDMLFDPPVWQDETLRLLTAAAARHEVVALTVRDPAELAASPLWAHAGNVLVECRDPESGRIEWLDTRRGGGVAAALEARDSRITESLARAGVEEVRLVTGDDPVLALRKYFRRVERRRTGHRRP